MEALGLSEGRGRSRQTKPTANSSPQPNRARAANSPFQPIKPDIRPPSRPVSVTDFQPPSDSPGAEHFVIPVAAGARMGMGMAAGDRSYYQHQYDDVREKLKHVGEPEFIQRNLKGTLSKMVYNDRVTDEHQMIDPLIHHYPQLPKHTLDSISKSLSRSGNKNIEKEDLKDFLNTLIRETNSHQASAQDVKKLLVSFCSRELRPKIERRLTRLTIRRGIANIRQALCPTTTVSACREKADNFTFSTTDPLDSLFDLEDLLYRCYPNAEDDVIEAMVKRQFMVSGPRAVTAESRRREKKHYSDHYGAEYTYEQWKEDLGDIVAEGFLAKRVSAVSKGGVNEADLTRDDDFTSSDEDMVVEPSQPLRKATKKASKGRGMSEENRYFYEEGRRVGAIEAQNRESRSESVPVQSSEQRRAGAAREKAYALKGPELATAKRKFKLSDLRGPDNEYVHENSPKLEYDIINQEFSPRKKIKRPPYENPFLGLPSGRTFISGAMLNHFRGRCVACSMLGHSNLHPDCPYAKVPQSFDLCGRCEAGFHATNKCYTKMDRVEGAIRRANGEVGHPN